MSTKAELRDRWTEEPWKGLIERFGQAYPSRSFEQLAPDLAELPLSESVSGFIDLRGARIAVTVKSQSCANLDLSYAITHYLVGDKEDMAMIQEMSLSDSEFVNCRFVETELLLNMEDKFTDCDFGKAKLKDSRIWESSFIRCGLAGTNLRGAEILETTFVDCDLSNANIGSVSLDDVRFENCNLLGVKYNKQTRFRKIEIVGAVECDDVLRQAMQGRTE